MLPSNFCVATQPVCAEAHGLPVQADRIESLRPASNFDENQHYNVLTGRRTNKNTVGSIGITVKAKTPHGAFAAWSFDVDAECTVRQLKDRLALFVSHKLWGGAYRVSVETYVARLYLDDDKVRSFLITNLAAFTGIQVPSRSVTNTQRQFHHSVSQRNSISQGRRREVFR